MEHVWNPPGWRWSRPTIVCLLIGASSLVGCAAEEESRARKCERLRDHVIELRVEGLPEAARAGHRSALRQALGGKFADDCQTLTARQLSCALAANEIVAATACSSDPATR